MSGDKLIVLWRDKKFLTGFALVILSIILGFYGKILFILKFYEPVQLITGLSIWAFSWILLFFGVFLVGWETIKTIQNQIKNNVKKTAKKGYDYTQNMGKKFQSKKLKLFDKR